MSILEHKEKLQIHNLTILEHKEGSLDPPLVHSRTQERLQMHNLSILEFKCDSRSTTYLFQTQIYHLTISRAERTISRSTKLTILYWSGTLDPPLVHSKFQGRLQIYHLSILDLDLPLGNYRAQRNISRSIAKEYLQIHHLSILEFKRDFRSTRLINSRIQE